MNRCLVQLLSISFSLICLFDGIQGQLCPALESPLYGSLSGPCLTNPGSTCSVRCNPGFEALGSCARVCQPNGSWTGLPLICLNRIITCPPLSLPENLSVGGPCFNVAGGICHFSCPVDSTLLGPGSIYCNNMGSWSASPPSCSPNGCQTLPALENGQLSGMCSTQATTNAVIHPGSICTFTCNPGYQLIGPDRLLCLSTSQWSQLPPRCQQIVRCTPLAPVTNALMTGSCSGDLIIPLNTCSVSCNPGYTLVGQALLTCTADGTWSSSLPSCILITCPSLTSTAQDRPIANCVNPQGLQLPDSNIVSGSTCRFSCPYCQVLIGSSSISCLPNGQWNSSVGTCSSINCPDITNIGNGQISGTCVRSTCMNSCSFSCNVGFILSSSINSLVCQPTGQWNGPVPQCIPQPRCSDLTSPNAFSFYRGNCQNAKSGDICELSCDSCYVASGRTRVNCDSVGNWDSSLGNCIPITCPSPPALPDFMTSQGSCNNARCDDICIFVCDSGYEIRGSSSLTCGPNGQWNQPFPRCVPSRCPDWSVPTGGLFINECPEGLNCPSLCPGIPNQSCKLRCGAGYRLVGTTEEVICTPSTLQWSQALPTCEPIR